MSSALLFTFSRQVNHRFGFFDKRVVQFKIIVIFLLSFKLTILSVIQIMTVNWEISKIV